MLKKYDEPQSPRERACLTCMMNLDRQMRGVFNKKDELDSPDDGGV